MAEGALELMTGLGHDRFAVAGHDRGGLVAARLALDHPEAVTSLAVLDIVPVLDMWESITADAALGAYHLFLLAQSPEVVEPMLRSAPKAFVDSFLDGWTHVPGAIDADHRAAYYQAFDPAGVCADYRAGATVDLEHDRADRDAGHRIAAPTVVLWQEPDGTPPPFDPLAIWQSWADDVTGHGLDSGHFLPEERPDHVATAIREHLDR